MLIRRPHGNHRSSGIEPLEIRHFLTSIGFLQHDLETPEYAGLFARSRAADMDGDGLLDMVSQGAVDLVWRRNLGDTFDRPIKIDAASSPVFFVLDLDSDGDNDILASKSSSPIWYENVAAGTFAESQPYALGDCSLPDRAHIAADVDNDGDIDFLGGAESCENQSQNATFVRHLAFGAAERVLDVADIDEDGDLDVLTTDSLTANSHLNMYRNVGTGAAVRFEKNNVPESNGINTAFFADLDGDADLDIFVPLAHGNNHWRENVDGEFMGDSRSIDTDTTGRVFPFDVNDDGATDFLVSNYGYNELKLFRNNGNATFGDPQLIDQTLLLSIESADIDGDGDMDLYSSWSKFEITWFENLNNENLAAHRIASGIPSQHISFGDFNGDGIDDILSLEGVEHFNATVIGWRQNLGNGQYGPRNYIGRRFDDAGQAFPFDVDVDGDMDVIVQNYPGLDWYKNDGLGGFTLADSIDLPGSIRSVYRSDFDQDGIDELLVGGDCDHPEPFVWNCFLGWVKPGPNGFALHPVLDEDSDAAVSSDLDGDGDEDILSIANGELVWYRNDGPEGFYYTDDILSTIMNVYAAAIKTADLDGDGDQDAILAADGSIVWFENLDGAGTFREDVPKWIGDPSLEISPGLEVADLDGDGDLDVILAELTRDGFLSWYENNDNASDFITHTIPYHEGVSALALNDFDGDGDLDLISSTFRGSLIWHENRLLGDADDDGEVTFEDFLTLSANFGAVDAAWSSGDFTGDREVGFEDFLALSANFGAKRRINNDGV